MVLLSRWSLVLAIGATLSCALGIEPLPAQKFPVGWRGDSSGNYADAQPPATWSPQKNIKWRLKIGKSNSSPLVVGDKILVMAEPDKLLCLQRDTGQLLWDATSRYEDVPPGNQPAKPPKYQTSCGFTTPTPVCDGENVYVLLGNGLVASYTLAGKRNWLVWLSAEQTSPYGRSASPILAGDLLIAPMTYLHGLDRKTGKTLWEAADVDSGYGTPVVVQVDKTPIIVTATGASLRASDGKVLAHDLAYLEYPSPIADGNIVYFIGPELKAQKFHMNGDQLQTTQLFTSTLDGEYIASPVLHDGLLHAITSAAVYSVIDAKTGKTVLGPKTLQLPPAGDPKVAAATVYSSPTIAGKSVYLSNTHGEQFVLSSRINLQRNIAQHPPRRLNR